MEKVPEFLEILPKIQERFPTQSWLCIECVTRNYDSRIQKHSLPNESEYTHLRTYEIAKLKVTNHVLPTSGEASYQTQVMPEHEEQTGKYPSLQKYRPLAGAYYLGYNQGSSEQVNSNTNAQCQCSDV